MSSETENGNLPDATTVILRGIRGRCPKCGQGKLYRSYLRPFGNCAGCGQDFESIRADDGPSWLTLLIVGFLDVPVAITFATSGLPDWLAFSMVAVLTVAAVLLILPPVKGALMGVLWRIGEIHARQGARD